MTGNFKQRLMHFARDENGATAVEFAIVAAVFLLLLMGIVEYGLYTFTQVSLEAAVTKAGRTAAIGLETPGCDRVCTVRNELQGLTRGLIHPDRIQVSAQTVAGGGAIAGDLCLGETGEPVVGMNPCPGSWSDTNGMPGYQAGGGANLGNGGELTEVRVNYPWRVLFPILGQFFGRNGVVMIQTSTVVYVEPI